MPVSPIEKAQRTAAPVAGWAYLLSFAVVVYVNFGIHDRLIVPDNALQTARNILANEVLYRVGIAGDLLYCFGIVVLVTALYVILRPINHGLALLAAFLRLVWVLMWLAVVLRFFDALRLLSATDVLHGFQPGQVEGLAWLNLETRVDYYYVGLLFGSLASTLCGYLWFKSRYIPRSIAVFGIASSVWCVACTLAYYVFPHFDSWVNLWAFDTPMGLFDIAVSLWLLTKGLNPPELIASVTTTPGVVRRTR